MRHTTKSTSLRTLMALGTVGLFASSMVPAQAVTPSSYSLGSVTFDQARTPDQASLIGNGQTLGGVTFSASLPNTVSSAINFPAGDTTGFNSGLTLGQLSGVASGAETGVRALNLPRGNNGSTSRHGIDVSWTTGLGIMNGAGDDFVIFESASSPTGIEGVMVRVHIGGTENWSDWHYYATAEFVATTASPTGEGLHIYKYDLTNFGLTSEQGIDHIQIANLKPTDRISGSSFDNGLGTLVGEGKVVFDDSTSVKPYAGSLDGGSPPDLFFTANSDYDPDPLYVAVLQPLAVVPEPTTMALMLGGLGLLGYSRRKR